MAFVVVVWFGRMVRAAGMVRLVRLGRVELAERDCAIGSRRAFGLPVWGRGLVICRGRET